MNGGVTSRQLIVDSTRHRRFPISNETLSPFTELETNRLLKRLSIEKQENFLLLFPNFSLLPNTIAPLPKTFVFVFLKIFAQFTFRPIFFFFLPLSCHRSFIRAVPYRTLKNPVNLQLLYNVTENSLDHN